MSTLPLRPSFTSIIRSVAIDVDLESGPFSEWVNQVAGQTTCLAIRRAIRTIPQANISVNQAKQSNYTKQLGQCFQTLRIKDYRRICKWIFLQLKQIPLYDYYPPEHVRRIRMITSPYTFLFETLKTSMNNKVILSDFASMHPFYSQLKEKIKYLSDKGLVNP